MMKMNAYYLLFLITILGCSQVSEDTIRLIPEGYQGTILIIFNQKDGAPKEYEGNNRIYRIPESGVLKTQFKPDYGVQKNKFFYLNDEGERKEIPFVMTYDKNKFDKMVNTKIYAYLEQTLGRVEKYDPKTKELLYTVQPAISFYIGNLRDVDNDYLEQLNFCYKHHY
jgi:hypothetical protein